MRLLLINGGQVGSNVSFTPTNGAAYVLDVSAQGTTISARLQRESDGQWLTSAGAFQSTQVDAVSATNSTNSAAFYPGLQFSEGSTPTSTYSDLVFYDFAAGNTPLNPGVNTLALTTYAPSLVQSGATTLTPGVTTLPLATYAPTLARSGAYYAVVSGNEPVWSSNYCLLVPTTTLAGIVLYSHGQNEQYNSISSATGTMLDTLNALTAAGYMVAASNAGGNYGWGNAQATNDQAALIKYLRATYSSVSTFVVMGSSMGGIGGLNLLGKGGVSGGIGFIGLQATYDLNAMHGGAYLSNIESSYGTVGQTWPYRAYGYDPALRNADELGGMPILLIASASDTTVPKAAHSDVMAAAHAKVARSVTQVTATGNHGDASHWNASAILSFVQACYARPIPRSTPATTKTVAATLYTDQAKTVLLSSTSVKWRWCDEPDPSKPSRLTDGGTTTTSAGGVLTITVRTNLTGAQLGRLDVATDDGTQASAWRAVSGPMTVA
jgi:dienelactone hydrolase